MLAQLRGSAQLSLRGGHLPVGPSFHPADRVHGGQKNAAGKMWHTQVAHACHPAGDAHCAAPCIRRFGGFGVGRTQGDDFRRVPRHLSDHCRLRGLSPYSLADAAVRGGEHPLCNTRPRNATFPARSCRSPIHRDDRRGGCCHVWHNGLWHKGRECFWAAGRLSCQ
jgi:hypothetical protein